MMMARKKATVPFAAPLQYCWAVLIASASLIIGVQSVLAQTGSASADPAPSRPADAIQTELGSSTENEDAALPGPVLPAGVGKAPPVVVSPQDIQLFFHTSEENFPKWDLDHDKQLSTSEVNHAILDPKSRGDLACVLAAFHSIQQKAKKAGDQDKKITLLDLRAMQQEPKRSKSIVRTFLRAKRKLSRHSAQLFASGAPHLSALHQGKTGDCYFLAALGSMTVSRPQDLRHLLKDDMDGKYTVQFPGREPIVVSGPGEAEFATFAESGDDGIWLNVLEKAFGTMKMAKTPDEDESQIYDKISGGSPGAAIRLITGHRTKRYPFNDEKAKESVRTDLAQALKEHRLVATSVKTMRSTGKTSGHALAVVSFDRVNDTVQIWNPWGSSVMYKDVGVRMEEGLFTMPVNDWLARFSSVTIEGTAPVSVSK